jgi:parvulin-like peptidyl-prolyl isomerase
LVADEETAKAVIDRLNKGEDFAALAKELSTDTGSGSQGGDLQWFGHGQMVTEFDDAVFAMTEIGQISAPVKSTFGYHIIQLLGKEMKPLSESEFEQEKDTKFQDWLEAQRTTANPEVFDNWFDKIPTVPTVPPSNPISQ